MYTKSPLLLLPLLYLTPLLPLQATQSEKEHKKMVRHLKFEEKPFLGSIKNPNSNLKIDFLA